MPRLARKTRLIPLCLSHDWNTGDLSQPADTGHRNQLDVTACFGLLQGVSDEVMSRPTDTRNDRARRPRPHMRFEKFGIPDFWFRGKYQLEPEPDQDLSGSDDQALESLDLRTCILPAHHDCAMKRRTTTDLVRHQRVLESDPKLESRSGLCCWIFIYIAIMELANIYLRLLHCSQDVTHQYTPFNSLSSASEGHCKQ